MKRTLGLVLAFLVAGAAPARTDPPEMRTAMNSTLPPVAAIEPHPVTLHGDTRADDYFWLRDDARESRRVLDYLEAENAFTARMMKPTEALQAAIFEEIKNRIQEDDQTVPFLEKGWYYYTRTAEGKQYPIYCRREGSLEAPEEIYVDQNELARGFDFYSLRAIEVSPDGRLVTWAADTDGSENYTLVIKDMTTGELLPERIASVVDVAWAMDNLTIFYTTQDEAKRAYRVWRHQLGQPVEQDRLIYDEPDELYNVFLYRTRSDAFVVFGSASSTTSECHVLPADQPASEPRMIEPRRTDVEYYVDHRGDRFYIRTNHDAKNFKVMTAPVATPGAAHWTELLPHRPDVKVQEIDLFSRFWVATERERGLVRYRITDFASGAFHYVEFPDPAYAVSTTGNYEFDTPAFRFNYQSMTTPSSIYDYDVTTRERTLRKRLAVLGKFDPADYVTERIYARAYDGAEIPISLVYRKGTPRDGSAPLVLYGYGSYGISTDATFSHARLSLLDRGVTWAIASIRGGGELGEPWHDAGKLRNKRNTFTDFITAAEYLVVHKYTSSDRLAALGGSAGGLLMGAIVNMRPDLFHCVVAKVPFVDVLNTMLDASLPLTVGEYLEWGNPNDPCDYSYIRTYCPYTNVSPQRYPIMLVTAGLNDPRVGYWEAAKWVAKLRATKLDGNLLLLKTNMGAGHAGASGRYDAWKETAFDYAFLLGELGVER